MAEPHLTEMDPSNSTNSAATAPLNTRTFDGCKQILKIQTLLTDFIHYQNHVQLTALTNLPEFITPPEELEKACIITHLTEEQAQLKLLHKYLGHPQYQQRGPQQDQRCHGPPMGNLVAMTPPLPLTLTLSQPGRHPQLICPRQTTPMYVTTTTASHATPSSTRGSPLTPTTATTVNLTTS